MNTQNQIINGIIELSKKVPKEYLTNEVLPITILTDLLYEEQDNLSEKSKAVLTGLAALLLKKIKIPDAKYADDNGAKYWTIEQMAEYLGKTVDELKAESAELFINNPGSINPLQ